MSATTRIEQVRVLLTSTSYPSDATDWKGRFIFDQAAALARLGAEVKLWAPPGELPTGVESALTTDDARWLGQLMARGGIAHLMRRRPWAGAWHGYQLLHRARAACLRSEGTDFYLINWLQNAFSLPDDRRAAIITVLGSDYPLLRLPGMRLALQKQFRRRPTLLAPNAAWMVPHLQSLFGDIARVEANPFGVAHEWFDLGSTGTRRGWLVVSRITRAKLGSLVEWGEGLFSSLRPLHLLGPMQEEIVLPAWIQHHGATNPQELRERWFPQTAGLLTLSRHDEGRPQVLIEAMAAGLPVVASDIAAHADLLRNGETGWLVRDRAELASALSAAEESDTSARIGAAAKEYVLKTIGTWDDCSRRYLTAAQALIQAAR